MKVHIWTISGADLEKYLWGGKRGAGIFEGWQHIAEGKRLYVDFVGVKLWCNVVGLKTGIRMKDTVSAELLNRLRANDVDMQSSNRK